MSSKSSPFQGLQSCLNPLTPVEPYLSLSEIYDFRQIINDSNQVYVKPTTKHSPLSARSLEMCTETLGDETGSHIDPNLELYSYLVIEKQSSNMITQQKTREFAEKIKHSSSFPPPLSSINGVKLQALREAGRLVITAIDFRDSRAYSRAERRNGTLKLFLVKDKLEEEDEEKLRRKRIGGRLYRCRCHGDGSVSRSCRPCLFVWLVLESLGFIF